MSIKDSLLKSKKKVLRWLLIVAVLLLMFFPYPYETGGPFRFLPIKRVEVHTQVSGEIKKVLVKEGDWVTENQTLAFLDTREHQKNLDITIANLDKVKVDLRLLELGPKPEEVEKAKRQVDTAQTRQEYSTREAERLKDMYEAGAVSEEEYDAAAKTAEVDTKRLEEAKAHLELVKSGARPEEIEAQKALVRDLETKVKYYRENVQFTKLVVPISGRVVTAYIETKVGQILEEGDLFAILEDARTIQAEIHIPEADIGEVSLGARVKVRPWAYPTKFFYGRVVSIAPIAENTPNGRIVRVLTEIPNPKHELKPDMTGKAKIKGEWKPVIVAFTRAVVRFFMVEVWSWFP